MTFPTFDPGEIAPSAWANLVGDFHDYRVIGLQAFGSIPALSWLEMTWSPVENPAGLLQSNGIDVFLPAGQIFLAVCTVEYNPSPAAADQLRLEAFEGGAVTRLRSDNQVDKAVATFSGLLAGALFGSNQNVRFRVFSDVGGSIPAGDSTNLTLIRVGG